MAWRACTHVIKLCISSCFAVEDCKAFPLEGLREVSLCCVEGVHHDEPVCVRGVLVRPVGGIQHGAEHLWCPRECAGAGAGATGGGVGFSLTVSTSVCHSHPTTDVNMPTEASEHEDITQRVRTPASVGCVAQTALIGLHGWPCNAAGVAKAECASLHAPLC